MMDTGSRIVASEAKEPRLRGHHASGGVMAHIVIVDDDLAIHHLLAEFFAELGHQVQGFENLKDASAYLQTDPSADLIVCDMRLPDGNGLDLMPVLRELTLDLPVILITAFGSAEIGANALKTGIFDYITKPLNLTELGVICNRALKLKSLEKNLLDLQSTVDDSRRFHGLIGNSAKMRDLFAVISKVADTGSSILITGESGTGKELVAKAIHERGRRGRGPFVAVNCSAIPAELLESELFGYKRGSFTGAIEDRKGLFEEAEGGTLFLDEIGDMPLTLQGKILRVLQDGEFSRVGWQCC